MTVLDSPGKSSIQYSERTLKRAERALQCSPFQLQLFTTMRFSSVSLNGIAGQSGVNSGYTRTTLTELAVENALLWLIQVGVLRREVDGQGITDSFRLTPLGRKLIDQWESQNQGIPQPSLCDRSINSLNRWLRFPL
ncbi:MAG: Npun_F0494 family protein [Planktothrix sp.]|uniref:Npun_F0494 family protein n=1 Tax=Planktothrix sp. TaxID=3088171 RepID=UPI0038D4EB19